MTSVRRSRPSRSAAVRLAAGLLAAGTLLSACGDDSAGTGAAEDPSGSGSSAPTEEPMEPSEEPTGSESPGGEEPEPTSPACSEVWVADQSFPQRYSGCFDEDKDGWVQAMVYRCSSGQQLVTYRRTFYAVKGEQVVETDVPLARDPGFEKALATCGA